MIIRKKYRFENAHTVRNCYSDRCKYSIHGHSYIVEVFLEAKGLDRAGMILDFGVMKNEVGDLIDSFDHAICFWNQDSEEYQTFMREHSARFIEMPVSPSAENLSYTLLAFVTAIVGNMELNNDEPEMLVRSVRVHETATGYAEAFYHDLGDAGFPDPDQLIRDTLFSRAIRDDWRDPYMLDALDTATFFYDEPEQQV